MPDSQGHIRDLLSPYLDNQVSREERCRIDEHLATCQSCRAELEQSRQLVELLRSAPRLRPPHSFALTPDMVRPRGLLLSLGRLAPFSGAAAAVALAALLFLDLTGASAVGNRYGSRDMVPQAGTAATSPALAAAPTQAPAAREAPAPAPTTAASASDEVLSADSGSATLTAALPAPDTAMPELAAGAAAAMPAATQAPPQVAQKAVSEPSSLVSASADGTEAPDGLPSPTPQAFSAPVLSTLPRTGGLAGEAKEATTVSPTSTAEAIAMDQATEAAPELGYRGAPDAGAGANRLRLGEAASAAVLVLSLGLWSAAALRAHQR
jgi:hypothetical protein